MKKRKDIPKANVAKIARRSTRARTAGGKKLNPEVMASAEQQALEGLKKRTEEGHLKAGRTPLRSRARDEELATGSLTIPSAMSPSSPKMKSFFSSRGRASTLRERIPGA